MTSNRNDLLYANYAQKNGFLENGNFKVQIEVKSWNLFTYFTRIILFLAYGPKLNSVSARKPKIKVFS